MASRNHNNKGKPQHNSQSQRNQGRKKGLSNNDLKTLQEMFGGMGITNGFITQVAQAHNYDVMQTGNYLLAYTDRIKKNGTKPKPQPQRKTNKKSHSPASRSPAPHSSTTRFPTPHSPAPRPSPCKNTKPPRQKPFSALLKGQPLLKFTERHAPTGAIKKITPKSPGELELERVVNFINTGIKVIVLLRGLPGSGKTHLAQLIVERTVKSCEDTLPDFHIFSTDAFFVWLGNGTYKFDRQRLPEAHEWNRIRFCEALKRGISPVIVDNTNTMVWEMHPYVAEGMKYGYAIEVLEPFTPWAFKEYELSLKNTHNVPRDNIKKMLERYDRHITGAKLLSILNLQYIENNKPPQQRDFPKLPDCQSTTSSSSSCSASDDDSSDDPNDSVDSMVMVPSLNRSDYGYLCNIVPRLNSSQLDEIIKNGSKNPLWDFLNAQNDGTLNHKSQSLSDLNEEKETHVSKSASDQNLTVTRRYTREDLLNMLPEAKRIQIQNRMDGTLPQRSRKTRRQLREMKDDCLPLIQVDDINDMIDWSGEGANLNVDDDDKSVENQRVFSLLDDDEPIFNNLAELLNENIPTSCDKNSLIEIEEDVDTTKLPTFKNFLKFFNPQQPLPSSFLSPLDVSVQISTESKSTMTNFNDFIILDGKIIVNDVDSSVIQTHSRDISNGCTNLAQHLPPPKILKLDKSSMTHEDNFLEDTSIKMRSSNDENQHLIELYTMFPKIRKDSVREIFNKCEGDVDWAVELLLDIPFNEEDLQIEDDASSRQDDESPVEEPETNDERMTSHEMDAILLLNKRIASSLVLSEDALKAKKQVEEQFVIGDSHYSEHCLKIRRLRHGELPPSAVEDVTSKTSDESDDETDSNETEDSFDDDECLEMSLGFDFVNRLDSIFGKENPNYPEGLQPVIQVPKSIAQQLHLLWLESYYQQVCAHEERWEQMLKEDEEFARQLQEQENELSASGNQPLVPTIQEILNMEIDLEIAKRGTECNESYEDLASRLTRQKLYEMFPEIAKDTINDILETFENKYVNTVNYLVCVMGDVGASPSTGEATLEGMFNEENLSNQEKQLIEQAKQASIQIVDTEHRPIIVVREAAGAASSSTSASPSKYGDAEYYREIGQQQLRLRNECLEKARNMYLRGLTSAALYYSELAQVHKNKYEHANQSAAIYFVNSHSQNHNNSTALLDLHYLYVSEAIQVLDLFIDNHISQLQTQNSKKCITLNLITGRGARSAGGRARVKPAVLRRLKQRNLRYHFINPGLLKFKLRHYDVMTNSLK